MASTNKTPNYDLSQYISSDKPTYLGDYNSDMLKIDTGIKNAADTAGDASGVAESANAVAQGAATSASSALTAANTASDTAKAAQTTANTALTNAGTAQSTANTAVSNAATANEGVLNIQTTLGGNKWTTPSRPTNINTVFDVTSQSVMFTYNSFLKMFIAYGKLPVGTSRDIEANEILFQLPSIIPRPTSQRTISTFCGAVGRTTSVPIPQYVKFYMEVTVDTSGNVRTPFKIGNTPGSADPCYELMFQGSFVIQDWL